MQTPLTFHEAQQGHVITTIVKDSIDKYNFTFSSEEDNIASDL